MFINFFFCITSLKNEGICVYINMYNEQIIKKSMLY